MVLTRGSTSLGDLSMRGFSLLIFALVGFVSGTVLGTALDGGIENPINSFLIGLLGAVAFAILQTTLVFPPKESHYARRSRALQRRNRRPRGPRQETAGSFNERMERFASNVQQRTKDHNEQSKMPLWISEECSDFEPSPPKSIGIIRMLLRRIRRVLAGK